MRTSRAQVILRLALRIGGGASCKINIVRGSGVSLSCAIPDPQALYTGKQLDVLLLARLKCCSFIRVPKFHTDMGGTEEENQVQSDEYELTKARGITYTYLVVVFLQ